MDKEYSELLGEELVTQITEKLEGKELFIGDRGNYVSGEEFNKLNVKLKASTSKAKSDLSNKAKVDTEKYNTLEGQIATLTEELKSTKSNYQMKEKNMLIDSTISTLGGRNVKSIKALLDLETISIENGSITGLDEQLESLQGTEGYLFTSKKAGVPIGLPTSTASNLNSIIRNQVG